MINYDEVGVIKADGSIEAVVKDADCAQTPAARAEVFKFRRKKS